MYGLNNLYTQAAKDYQTNFANNINTHAWSRIRRYFRYRHPDANNSVVYQTMKFMFKHPKDRHSFTPDEELLATFAEDLAYRNAEYKPHKRPYGNDSVYFSRIQSSYWPSYVPIFYRLQRFIEMERNNRVEVVEAAAAVISKRKQKQKQRISKKRGERRLRELRRRRNRRDKKLHKKSKEKREEQNKSRKRKQKHKDRQRHDKLDKPQTPKKPQKPKQPKKTRDEKRSRKAKKAEKTEKSRQIRLENPKKTTRNRRRSYRNFQLVPQYTHGLKHVRIDTKALHGILSQLVKRKIIPKKELPTQIETQRNQRVFWSRFFQVEKFETKTHIFAYSICTDGYAVSMTMKRDVKDETGECIQWISLQYNASHI